MKSLPLCSDLKKFLTEVVHLPGYEKVTERIKQLIPKLITSENGGIWADIKDILSRHLSATIECLTNYDSMDSLDFENLGTKWTLGHDGSGSHSEFRSCKMDTQNINLGGIRLIQIQSGDNVIYRETNFGPETEVPIFLGMYYKSFI